MKAFAKGKFTVQHPHRSHKAYCERYRIKEQGVYSEKCCQYGAKISPQNYWVLLSDTEDGHKDSWRSSALRHLGLMRVYVSGDYHLMNHPASESENWCETVCCIMYVV